MATWADIQRLAADLHRAQFTDTAKRLSDANCVEIISTLIKNGALNVVTTKNGKEYVTKRHLVTEVKNECLAAGGRINIVELVRILCVESEHIETAIATIVTDYDDEFVSCIGELFSMDYIEDVFKRLNEGLESAGQLSICQLDQSWDLPIEFLNHHILPHLGTRIDAKRFEDQIYTRFFYDLQRNKLRAALIALTKPTVLSAIYDTFDIPEALFFNIWNELRKDNQLPGSLIGGKNSIKAVYVPSQHDSLVRQYVRNALLSNNFIETSTLKKLLISNAKAYFKDILLADKFNECIFLQSGVVHKDVWQQLICAIEEHVQSNHFCIIEQQLPTVLSDLSDADIETLISTLKKNHSSWYIVSGDEHIVYERAFIEKTLTELDSWLQQKAAADAPSLIDRLKHLQTQKAKKLVNEAGKKPTNDDDDDWGTEKGNKKKGGKGGKKGAATASKAKSPAPANQTSQTEADIASVLKLDPEELKQQLRQSVTIPNALFDELFDHIQQPTNAKYKELVETKIRFVDQTDAKDQRRSLEEKQLKAQLIYDQICVFESGSSEFSESLAVDMRAYLLRSLCNDFCIQVLLAFVDCPSEPSSISAKLRDELIGSILETETREALTELFTAQRVSSEQFHEAVQKLRSACSFTIHQPDKRRRAEVIAERRQTLRSKIEEIENDPPTALLLIVLYLFATLTDESVIHASGKFVGPLIKHLASIKKDASSVELTNQLTEAQLLVVECAKKKNANEKLNEELANKIETLKQRVLS